MKRIILTVLSLMLALCAAGCVGRGGDDTGVEAKEPMGDTLLSILDEDTRAYLEGFSADSAELMLLNYDQHYPVAVVTDKEVMLSVVEALSAVRVTAKTNVSVTDAYNSLRFVTAEGAAYGVSFENSCFHAPQQGSHGQNYEIENDKDFWKLFRSIAEDGWTQAQENTAKYLSDPVSYSALALEAGFPPRFSCEVVSLDTAPTDDKRWLDACAVLRFTNGSADYLTGAACTVCFLDYDGYVVGKAAVSADFSAAPIAPGESGEYTVRERVFDTNSLMAAASGGVNGLLVAVTGVSTQSLAAPVTGTPLFEFYGDADIRAFAESFYDDPPQKLTVILNWYSPRESTAADVETVTAAFEALKGVHVGEQVPEIYTDSDTHFCFAYGDGREYTFSFNGGNLLLQSDEHPYQSCYAISGTEELSAFLNLIFEQ